MRFFFILLVCPLLAFGFSETELDSLEDSGTKTFSKSLWRNNFGFSLIRNLDIEAQHRNYSKSAKSEDKESGSKFCDFNSDNSICDLSDLYYSLDFTVYYSLLKWAEKNSNLSFLKGAELFLSASFTSNFKDGGCSNLDGYDNWQSYLKCGVGDISAGWTLPIYQKESFISYFNFSALLFPLSKRSQDLSLKTGLNGSISTLYFLKKQAKWSWAISSQHSLSYNHFTVPWSNETWESFNNPLASRQGLSLILKQRLNKYLPANTSVSFGYNFIINADNTYWYAIEMEKWLNENTVSDPEFGIIGVNIPGTAEQVPIIKEVCQVKNRLGTVLACGSRYQELSLGASSSWKLDKRWYLRLSVSWRDLISAYSPFNDNKKLYSEKDKKVSTSKYSSLSLDKWFFYLKTSYAF